MSLPDLLQQSAAHASLFVPTAILLGALHGLELGHSKTMADPDGRTQHVTVGRLADAPDAQPTTWLFEEGPALRLSEQISEKDKNGFELARPGPGERMVRPRIGRRPHRRR